MSLTISYHTLAVTPQPCLPLAVRAYWQIPGANPGIIPVGPLAPEFPPKVQAENVVRNVGSAGQIIKIFQGGKTTKQTQTQTKPKLMKAKTNQVAE